MASNNILKIFYFIFTDILMIIWHPPCIYGNNKSILFSG